MARGTGAVPECFAHTGRSGSGNWRETKVLETTRHEEWRCPALESELKCLLEEADGRLGSRMTLSRARDCSVVGAGATGPT